MEDTQGGTPGLGVLAMLTLIFMVLCLIVTLLVGGSVLLYGVISTTDSAETVDVEAGEAESVEDTEAPAVATEEPAAEESEGADGEHNEAEATEEPAETGALIPVLTLDGQVLA